MSTCQVAPEAPAFQAVQSPLTGAAIFLVMEVTPRQESLGAVRRLCGDLAGLVRAVGFRDIEAGLSCVVGFGADVWGRLGQAAPAGLHPFRAVRSGDRLAPATPGDLLFHIRATRMDLCFELATQIAGRLEGATTLADEVHGFRYFDDRDLIGFVDGTENPTGQDAFRATVVGAEDPDFAGGSYVVVQKYLHDLDRWNELSVEEQERIIGRTKLSDIELDESVKPSSAHNALTTIVEDGDEVQIVRDNMPFGRPGSGEYGTYFIGYARSPRVIEQMLANMFVGSPEGNYDRLLDFSTAVTGTLFFCPAVPLLESIAGSDGPATSGAGADGPATDGAGAAAPARGPAGAGTSGEGRKRGSDDGSLGIGSLKGATHDE